MYTADSTTITIIGCRVEEDERLLAALMRPPSQLTGVSVCSA